MPTDALTFSFDDLVVRARALVHPGQRRVLGIAGAPGAGKSTLCMALAAALGADAALVTMDGFHLTNDELLRLGRRDRKGAPDTFDVDGYAALLRRLRGEQDVAIYAPRFDRALEESLGGAVRVPAQTPLIITEGNYLLLQEQGWETVRDSIDETWYLDIPADLRADRLIARRQSYGESPEDAASWVESVDQVNAALIDVTRPFADVVVQLTTHLSSAS